MRDKKPSPETDSSKTGETAKPDAPARPAESGGPQGPEPTRYGDWERGGKCVDF